MYLGRNKIFTAMLMLLVFTGQPLAFAVASCEEDQQAQFGDMAVDATDNSCCIVGINSSSTSSTGEATSTNCDNQDCSIWGNCLSLLIPVLSNPVEQAIHSPQRINLYTQQATSQSPTSLYRPPISR